MIVLCDSSIAESNQQLPFINILAHAWSLNSATITVGYGSTTVVWWVTFNKAGSVRLQFDVQARTASASNTLLKVNLNTTNILTQYVTDTTPKTIYAGVQAVIPGDRLEIAGTIASSSLYTMEARNIYLYANTLDILRDMYYE